MKQKKIFPVDWIGYHPYDRVDETDHYYVKIANEVLDLLEAPSIQNAFPSFETKKEVACGVTAWFEDVASEVGIWRAFTNECRKLYGRPLPFVEIEKDEYLDGAINPEDVNFLLWHFLQRLNPEKIINPENQGIKTVAYDLYDLLDTYYEEAPYNVRLLDYVNFAGKEKGMKDFFEFRKLLEWLHFNCYINYGNSKNYKEELHRIIEQYEPNPKHFAEVAYEQKIYDIFKQPNYLLALTTPELYSRIARTYLLDDEYISMFDNIEYRPQRKYYLEAEDSEYYYLADVLTNEEYSMLKKSMGDRPKAIPGITAFSCALVRFGGAWWQNGVMVTFDRKELTQKDLEDTEKREKENKKATYEAFIKASKGKPLIYFSSDKELSNFLTKSMKYNYLEGLKEIEAGAGLIMTATPDGGIMMQKAGLKSIKDPRNPFYDQSIARQEAIYFYIIPDFFPIEIVQYLTNNNYLPDAVLNSVKVEDRDRKLVEENWDFMIRYYQRKVPLSLQ